MNKPDTMSFYVKAEDLDETKKAVRSLDSLRFKENPMKLGNEFYIFVLGSYKDLNNLTEYLSNKMSNRHRTYN